MSKQYYNSCIFIFIVWFGWVGLVYLLGLVHVAEEEDYGVELNQQSTEQIQFQGGPTYTVIQLAIYNLVYYNTFKSILKPD